MTKHKCLGCGIEFLTKNGQKFCKKCQNITKQCPQCGIIFKLTPKQLTKYRKYGDKELYYCSNKCAANSGTTRKRYQETCKKHMGCEHPMANPEFREQCKKSYKEKTGYDHWMKNPSVIQKRKETWIKKYMADNPMKNKSIQNKAKQTWTNNLGVDHPSKSLKVVKKMQQTMEEKYGVKHAMEVPEFIEKRRQTWLRTIGFENPGQSPACRDKAICTNNAKYGKDSYCQTEEFLKKRKATWRKKYGIDNPMKVPQIQEIAAKRALKTRRTNQNIPKTERTFKNNLLKAGYIENKDFFVEYKSDKYPFRCDFYLKEFDLYIELNCHPAHGYHWFNSKSSEDTKIKKQLQDKNTTFYNSVVKTWTVEDVKKRKIAKKNDLNYVVIWTEKEISDWFQNEMPVRKDWK